jgi:membrane protein required for colicin V production
MENISAITTFDAIALVILGYSGLVGLRRGFTTELLTLGAWAGAIFFTLFAISWGAQEFGRDIIQPDILADILTALVLFIAGLMLFRYLAAFIGDMMKGGPVGGFDRLFGTVFGLLRGALIIAAAFLLVTHFMADDEEPDWIRDAQLRPLASSGAEMLRIVVPGLLNREQTSAILDDMRDSMPTGLNLPDGLNAGEAIDAARDSLPDAAARQELTDMLEDMLDDAATDEAEEGPDDGNGGSRG